MRHRSTVTVVLSLFFILAVQGNALARKDMQTRFGEVAVTSDNVFMVNGKPTKPEMKGKGNVDLVDSFQLDKRDVLLVKDSGGPDCKSVFVFMSISSESLDTTPVFGTCTEKIEVIKKGEAIEVTMPGPESNQESVYTLKDWKLTESTRALPESKISLLKDGFKGIKWGTGFDGMSQMFDLEFANVANGVEYYKTDKIDKTIKGVDAKVIFLGFNSKTKKFCVMQAALPTTSVASSRVVLSLLVEDFGKRPEDSDVSWEDEDTHIRFVPSRPSSALEIYKKSLMPSDADMIPGQKQGW